MSGSGSFSGPNVFCSCYVIALANYDGIKEWRRQSESKKNVLMEKYPERKSETLAELLSSLFFCYCIILSEDVVVLFR